MLHDQCVDSIKENKCWTESLTKAAFCLNKGLCQDYVYQKTTRRLNTELAS